MDEPIGPRVSKIEAARPEPDGVYLRLFHGRKTVDEDMDDWGEDGPVFGPFPYFHTTYGSEIKFGDEAHVLSIVKGLLVYYDGMYYGDWSVFGADALDKLKPVPFDTAKAALTKSPLNFVQRVGRGLRIARPLSLRIMTDDGRSFPITEQAAPEVYEAYREWIAAEAHSREEDMAADRMKGEADSYLLRIGITDTFTDQVDERNA